MFTVHHQEPSGHRSTYIARTLAYDPKEPSKGVWLTLPNGHPLPLRNGRVWRELPDGQVVEYPLS